MRFKVPGHAVEFEIPDEFCSKGAFLVNLRRTKCRSLPHGRLIGGATHDRACRPNPPVYGAHYMLAVEANPSSRFRQSRRISRITARAQKHQYYTATLQREGDDVKEPFEAFHTPLLHPVGSACLELVLTQHSPWAWAT